MKLKDKVAVITGGGRGIGKAIALHYAREGAKLALCARTSTELDQTVGEIRALKTEAEGWTCDVSMEDSAREFIANAFKKFGRIDVLVNNAGVMTRPAPMTELDVKKWDYTIAVNLRGPFLITQAVLPIMMKQKSGSIINVSSIDRARRLREFHRLRDIKMGIGRIHPNPRGGSSIESYSGQFRRARLRRHQAHRLSRQQT